MVLLTWLQVFAIIDISIRKPFTWVWHCPIIESVIIDVTLALAIIEISNINIIASITKGIDVTAALAIIAIHSITKGIDENVAVGIIDYH